MTLYRMDFGKGGGLIPLSPEGKNDLPVGTVLHLNGYSNPDYVIVKNFGIDPKFPGYGAKYLTVELVTLQQRRHDAYELKWLAEKKHGGIQIYITDRRMSAEETEGIWQKSEALRLQEEEQKRKKEAAYQQDLEVGKKIIEAKRPPWAKAIIVAYEEFDACDSQTDYYATRDGPAFLIAWSGHMKDVFSEMRKAAKESGMPEIQHFASPPDVDHNGAKQTPENKTWWHPRDEHREKYSMGAGYYLKDAGRYSTGWKVEKWPLSDWRMKDIYLIAGQGRYKVPQNSPADGPAGENQAVDGITITKNPEKNGIEIRFPSKPEQSVLEALKGHGWRWSRFSHCWYNRDTEENEAFASSLAQTKANNGKT